MVSFTPLIEERPRSVPKAVAVVVGAGVVVLCVIAAVTVSSHDSSSGSSGTSATGATEMYAAATGPSVNLAAVVGSSATGIGAISYENSGDITATYDIATWAPWGLSLSGNGIMAEAGATGALRALYETGNLDGLSTISSVSGGSWFNTQFGFSGDYFTGVIGTAPGSADIVSWYQSYQGKAMPGLFGAFGAGITTWEGIIGGMYGWDKANLDKPALAKNRAGFQKADLLFCTSFAGASSLMSDNSTVVQMTANGTVMSETVPAFWRVPGSSTSGVSNWNIPDAHSGPHADPSDLRSLAWNIEGDSSQMTSDEATVLPTPTVSKIGAMSSAANGITANPVLSAAFTPASAYSSMFGSGINPDNGVCTSANEPEFKCQFPSMMAMDGCYSDNLGFALNVGYLQKKHPGKKLRLMSVSSEMCDRTTDPTCLESVKGSSFRSLFADSPYPTTEGWLPAIVPGPNRTIFAESITDMQALGQQTGAGGMTFTTGTFTTIENTRFGVAAGTTVAILTLNLNGPLYLQGQSAGQTAGLSQVAANSYASWKSLFSTLSKNQGLDSAEAYLYYQTQGISA